MGQINNTFDMQLLKERIILVDAPLSIDCTHVHRTSVQFLVFLVFLESLEFLFDGSLMLFLYISPQGILLHSVCGKVSIFAANKYILEVCIRKDTNIYQTFIYYGRGFFVFFIY